MSSELPGGHKQQPIKDDGLRKMLTWTFIALVVSLLMAFIGVALAVRYFDRP